MQIRDQSFDEGDEQCSLGEVHHDFRYSLEVKIWRPNGTHVHIDAVSKLQG